MSTPISPDHYQGHVECIDAIHANNTREEFLGHCKDSAMAYLWRAGKKDDILQDFHKARRYLDFAINTMEGRGPKDDAVPCPLLANPLKDAKTLQQHVTEWQDATFPKMEVQSYMQKLKSEVQELDAAIQYDYTLTVGELADVQIVLWGLAHKLGINLDAAVEDKHRINQQRKWERMKDETYQHMEEVNA